MVCSNCTLVALFYTLHRVRTTHISIFLKICHYCAFSSSVPYAWNSYPLLQTGKTVATLKSQVTVLSSVELSCPSRVRMHLPLSSTLAGDGDSACLRTSCLASWWPFLCFCPPLHWGVPKADFWKYRLHHAWYLLHVQYMPVEGMSWSLHIYDALTLRVLTWVCVQITQSLPCYYFLFYFIYLEQGFLKNTFNWNKSYHIMIWLIFIIFCCSRQTPPSFP